MQAEGIVSTGTHSSISARRPRFSPLAVFVGFPKNSSTRSRIMVRATLPLSLALVLVVASSRLIADPAAPFDGKSLAGLKVRVGSSPAWA